MRHSHLSKIRLIEILERFPNLCVGVLGDFFLDLYMVLDKQLSEISLETGLAANQVVSMRKSPGAAGTVASILRSLDVQVKAIGFTGDDGNGYDLRNGLLKRGVDCEFLSTFNTRFTPTYIKPMLMDKNIETEISRMDIKNRRTLEMEEMTVILSNIRVILPEIDTLIIIDQVQELNCGVITDWILEGIRNLSEQYPAKPFFGDSRQHAKRLKNIILKCNLEEAIEALGEGKREKSKSGAEKIGEELSRRTNKPVFLTMGSEGIVVFSKDGNSHIPAIKVEGPLDIVGAGDSVMAAVSASICAGASLVEAASIGMITASIIVQQIGTTGTVTRTQLIERYSEFFEDFK
jgi:rfaE bifunctional protein kinase chain/domain